MGALSFAADTLASLSAAFASKNPPPGLVNLTRLTLELDEQAHRLFGEFSTGMKMLYQHGNRNPCNVTQISQQNLKLLHTNLKANPSFRMLMARVRENSHATDNWAWLPLLSTEQISAGILFLPSDSSISPNSSGTNLTMHQSELQAPFANNLGSAHVRQHYLGLEGNTEINLRQNYESSNILLKHGESIATVNASANVNRISALQGNSLILSIQLSTA